jgi:hypothetical protein
VVHWVAPPTPESTTRFAVLRRHRLFPLTLLAFLEGSYHDRFLGALQSFVCDRIGMDSAPSDRSNPHS